MNTIPSNSVSQSLDHWIAIHGVGKKPGTQKFHRELVAVIKSHWRDPDQRPEAVSEEDVLAFAGAVAHYSPSRWNGMVHVLRSLVPAARILRQRKLRFREFNPPSQLQFAALLAEADRLPRSQCGLVIRFLAFTGLRLAEARALRWDHVHADRIEVPAAAAKSGRARSVPRMPGIDEVLNRLRELDGTGYVLPRPAFRRGLDKACLRAGVGHLSAHSFRHLFATRCIESGVDVPTVARWLGHQDGGALLSRMYFHLLDDHSRQMAARVRIAA